MSNKYACGVSNGPINMADLEQMISCGFGAYVLLHYQMQYLERLRQATDGPLALRHYDKGFLEKPAVDYAQAVATVAIQARPYTDQIIADNETNLEQESGKDFSDIDKVILWKVDVARELRRLCPWLTLHSGAFAPVRNWWAYYVALADAYIEARAQGLKLWDRIDVHCYGDLWEMQQICRGVMSLFPQDVQICVTEFNGPGSLEFFQWASGQERIEFAAYYSWGWYQPDDPNWDKDLRGSALEQQIREADKLDIQPDSGGDNMPIDEATLLAKITRLEDQNALITDALKCLLQGKFTGADSVAGKVVALQGGEPLDFVPTFPNA